MQIHLRALGCRLNEAELETWASEFSALGHGLTTDPRRADVLVLNTCAVTAEAGRKSMQTARRLHRDNPEAKLVLSGCHATLEPERAGNEVGVDLVVGNVDKPRLVDIAVRELNLAAAPVMATEPGASALFARGRERAFVKIQDGCRYRCTFCIVTVARGAERSRPVGEIVNEINRLSEQGVQEVVLTGVHVGGYGSDLGRSLFELVRAILADTDMPRLRFASVEPWDLPEMFFSLFASSRLMPHMHLPIQSGSDSVLRRMARRCKTAEFRALVREIREQLPSFNVTTDIIVGFPGETEEEWRQTLAFVEEMKFGHLHIFPYSPRKGTKAAGLSGQLPRELKNQRSAKLHRLGERLKRDTSQRFLGRAVPVLWEGAGEPLGAGRLRYRGYTPNYVRAAVVVDESVALSGRIEMARLSAVGGDGSAVEAVLSSEKHNP